ncbi:zinc-binding metallopeptidase family protein [Aquabacterium humicola]|uniref:zinc-binding metallopeptidase family protein n=1 Tax=Aquabacterium humicola TaxID=3237377 RepID=UPI0025435180|nr:putative zinc-binding metallopeptidase [Rubrivivax pictus]
MIRFACGRCGQTVFFDNTHCGACGALLGYLPAERRMGAFEPADAAAPRWTRLGRKRLRGHRPCPNRAQGVCNWMLDPGDSATLCRSCRLTTVIPDLTVDGNLTRWAAIEAAKRRLLFTLMDLRLAPEPKADADDAQGLVVHLLAATPDGPPVMTGHRNGVVTIDIAEADDVHREATRVAFGEPVRTLLGHLRHEAAHYLQYRWIAGRPDAEARCREVFGDERIDYAEALARYHAEGPPADWSSRFVSAYASAHPWEDWAETCAHVLLVIDAVETATAWGLRLPSVGADGLRRAAADGLQLAGAAAKARAPTPMRAPIDRLVLEHWLPVAQLVNAMNRSLGLADAYPFLMPDAVLRKMAAVQALLADAAAGAPAGALAAGAAPVGAPAPPDDIQCSGVVSTVGDA